MYAVIRSYTGASELMDEMMAKRDDVERVMMGVPGARAYYAVRTGDGLTAIGICDDKAGADASTRAAAEWVKENLPGASIGAPTVIEGDVFLTL